MCLYNSVQAAGVSHQCVQLQHNHGATLPPSAQTRTCMTHSQQLSLLHLPLRSHLPSPPLVKLEFLIHCTSCLPQTNSPKEQKTAAKWKESGYDK